MSYKNDDKKLRQKRIDFLKKEIDSVSEKILSITGYRNIHSLNGTYGGKYAEYIDTKNAVIDTTEQFRSLYYQGFLRKLEELGSDAKIGNVRYDAFVKYRDNKEVQVWLDYFLERTFLKNYEALSKVRPKDEDAFIWIGQENASYGIFITPRFVNGQWENDNSEIRHFKPTYWSIGHILKTGFVIPSEDDKIIFNDIEQYLAFFKNTLVRYSRSKHEVEIAKRYCEYVRKLTNQKDVPMLIPELRYEGIKRDHKYRLDFTIINPYNMSKIGFEISPWSTHGELTGTNNKTQKKINEEALANFEKETKKMKSYFLNRDITVLVYTGTELDDYDQIFSNIQKYLTPQNTSKQLEIQSKENLLAFTPDI